MDIGALHTLPSESQDHLDIIVLIVLEIQFDLLLVPTNWVVEEEFLEGWQGLNCLCFGLLDFG